MCFTSSSISLFIAQPCPSSHVQIQSRLMGGVNDRDSASSGEVFSFPFLSYFKLCVSFAVENVIQKIRISHLLRFKMQKCATFQQKSVFMYHTVMQPYCNATQRWLQPALLCELATFHWSLACKWLL